MAQMLDAVRTDQEQRHIRATQPPTGPNGPNAAGGRDQDLFAAIATFLGLIMEDDPQAHMAGHMAATMR
eukprot:10572647-Prorocentrum_lima.AAC.1